MAPDALIGRAPRSRPRRFPALGAAILIVRPLGVLEQRHRHATGHCLIRWRRSEFAARAGHAPGFLAELPSTTAGVSLPPGPTPSGPVASQDPGATPPSPDVGGLDAGTRAALQAIIDHARAEDNVPAISVAVPAGGRTQLDRRLRATASCHR